MGREWSIIEHTIVDGELVKSEEIIRDIPAIARRKFELKIYFQ